jgi:hypothetical protein
MTDNLQDRYQKIIDNISKLQEQEKQLYSDLEDVSLAEDKRQDIITNINNISQMRVNLYASLYDMYSMYQQNASISNTAMGQTLVAIDILENELNQSKKRMNLLEEQKNNKLRLVEINTYYGKRYNTYSKLMKTIVYICIPIIILALLFNYGILPINIYRLLNGIVLIIGTVLIGLQLIDIFNRDNMNWDEYNWYFNKDDAPSINNSTDMLDNDTSDPWGSVSVTCVGSACCYKGSTYDSVQNICIPDKNKEAFESLGMYSNLPLKYASVNENIRPIMSSLSSF